VAQAARCPRRQPPQGDHPATVPDECLAALRSRGDRNGFIRLPEKAKCGQKLRITLRCVYGTDWNLQGLLRHKERLPARNLVADCPVLLKYRGAGQSLSKNSRHKSP